jgi:hypothetical protein
MSKKDSAGIAGSQLLSLILMIDCYKIAPENIDFM